MTNRHYIAVIGKNTTDAFIVMRSSSTRVYVSASEAKAGSKEFTWSGAHGQHKAYEINRKLAVQVRAAIQGRWRGRNPGKKVGDMTPSDSFMSREDNLPLWGKLILETGA